jgi:hypothetical protein
MHTLAKQELADRNCDLESKEVAEKQRVILYLSRENFIEVGLLF